MHRRIVDLLWAERSTSPWPKGRPRGSKAQGRAYENKLGVALGPVAERHHWIKFCDLNGLGYCCPDFVIPRQGYFLVLEAKLTDVPEAKTQLTELYFPVLRKLYSCPVIGVVVCKNLTRESRGLAGSLLEAESAALRGGLPTLQWLGRGPL